jgi:hypothetical protein
VPPFSPVFSHRHVTNARQKKASSHREEDDPSVGGALLSFVQVWSVLREGFHPPGGIRPSTKRLFLENQKVCKEQVLIFIDG